VQKRNATLWHQTVILDPLTERLKTLKNAMIRGPQNSSKKGL